MAVDSIFIENVSMRGKLQSLHELKTQTQSARYYAVRHILESSYRCIYRQLRVV